MKDLELLLKDYNSRILNSYFKEVKLITEGGLLDIDYKRESNIFFSYNLFDMKKRDLNIYIRENEIKYSKDVLRIAMLHETLKAYISHMIFKGDDKKEILKSIKYTNINIMETFVPEDYHSNLKWKLDEITDNYHILASKMLKKSISFDKSKYKLPLYITEKSIDNVIDDLVSKGLDRQVATIYCFYKMSSTNL